MIKPRWMSPVSWERLGRLVDGSGHETADVLDEIVAQGLDEAERRLALDDPTKGLRACEKCGGPGPCLWADSGHDRYRYLCRACHPEPDAGFFTRTTGGRS